MNKKVVFQNNEGEYIILLNDGDHLWTNCLFGADDFKNRPIKVAIEQTDSLEGMFKLVTIVGADITEAPKLKMFFDIGQ